MSEKMIKVVITKLGEQKLDKIVDAVSEDVTNEFIPRCGQSHLFTEKTGKSLIAKKYGKKCATPTKEDLKEKAPKKEDLKEKAPKK